MPGFHKHGLLPVNPEVNCLGFKSAVRTQDVELHLHVEKQGQGQWQWLPHTHFRLNSNPSIILL